MKMQDAIFEALKRERDVFQLYVVAFMRAKAVEISLRPEYLGQRVVVNCSKHDETWDLYVEEIPQRPSQLDDFDMHMDRWGREFGFTMMPDVQIEAVDGRVVLDEAY
jgi:hypothetical protein